MVDTTSHSHSEKLLQELVEWTVRDAVQTQISEIRQEIDKKMKQEYCSALQKAIEKVRSPLAQPQQPGAPWKKHQIPKSVRNCLWDEYFTEDHAKGKCYVCQQEIKISNFEAGHVVAATNGGSDNIENLRPLCGLCNKSMGSKNLEEFKTYYHRSKAKHNNNENNSDSPSSEGEKKPDSLVPPRKKSKKS